MRLNLDPAPRAGVTLRSWTVDDSPTDHLPLGAEDRILQLEATQNLRDQATGWFANPSSQVAVTVGSAVAARRYLGYSFAQFAMPVVGGPTRPFIWNPAANVFAPPVVLPLVIEWSDGRVSLLAPLDGWHEQIIAVDQDDDGVHGFRWGWQGDLDRIPVDTTATLGIFEDGSVAAAFARWRQVLVSHRGRPLPHRPADPVTTHLSYWTDNGAAYWYRREPGESPPMSIVDSVVAKVDELDQLGLPVRSVELDSWFYPHEITRPVTAIETANEAAIEAADSSVATDGDELHEIPPTGMLRWEPRDDVMPAGMAEVRRRLNERPLVLHSRHISDQSPYLDDGEWWTDYGAHPVDPGFFERWFDDAKAWGATCIEQDWMLMIWFGIGQLRAEPGRALAWQVSLDRFAAARQQTLLWCMATPGDLLATVELDRICAVRTSDDYRYAHDPARLWRWFLTVNRLADTLDLPVSKDCFLTASDPGPSGHDGDPWVEVESLLAGLSTGVVGIGDRVGRTDPGIVRRLCRADGLLVGPDRALALADQSFFDQPDDPRPTWAETISTQPAGTWRYVVALHLTADDTPVTGRFELGQSMLVYDWRSGVAEVADGIDVTLEHRDWRLLVCCPIEQRDGLASAVIGDPTRYATASTAALSIDTGGTVEAHLADEEQTATVRRWSEAEGLVDHTLHRSD
jgi:hypothetical protein